MLLGWFFIPVYMAAGVYTMPQYMTRRFGGQRVRVTLAVLTIMLYVFTKISVRICTTKSCKYQLGQKLEGALFPQADLFAGALFISESLGYQTSSAIYVSILVLLCACGIFTIFGGFSAVIWTDMLQTLLMITGAVIVSIKGK